MKLDLSSADLAPSGFVTVDFMPCFLENIASGENLDANTLFKNEIPRKRKGDKNEEKNPNILLS